MVAAAVFLVAETSIFCLAPDQITLRYAPWKAVQHYRWQDVVAVQTACHRTKAGDYHFNLKYDLMLGYEKGVNIADSVPDFEPGFEPMMKAFAASGHHPPLDSHWVEWDCGYRNVELLTRQP